MQNPLKKTLFALYVLVIVCMAAATVVEKYSGTDFVRSNVYGAWWFSLLWAVLTAAGVVYFLRHRCKSWSGIAIHLSFVVILAGAFVTHVAWYTATKDAGVYADGGNGKPMVKRFTYALTRASLQDGPGANAIWNITNVSRPDRPKLYTTNAWAAAMAEDKEVIEKIKNDPTSPFWASTDDEISKRVNGLLQPGTNQFSNEWHNFEPEMSADHFYEFMVWHRGLAIPRARNLNDARVQQGKKVFMEIGCANCHRPSWKTGSDNYWTPNMIAGKKLPRYAHQTIYPYSDMMQHKLYMANDIHGSWCRTTPLWGRGLAATNGSGVERLHDCRARNEVEAIMWHAYSKNSHAYNSALKFYNLSKADRDAVVMFLRSI